MLVNKHILYLLKYKIHSLKLPNNFQHYIYARKAMLKCNINKMFSANEIRFTQVDRVTQGRFYH